MNTVIFGCKLPHGIVLHDVNDKPVVINGMNTAMVMGGYGLTHVPADTAAYLQAAYADFEPFKSNAIFAHTSVASVIDMGAELADEKTGFEGMDAAPKGIDPNKPGYVGPDQAAAALIAQQIDVNANTPRQVKKPSKPEDRAAAMELAATMVS